MSAPEIGEALSISKGSQYGYASIIGVRIICLGAVGAEGSLRGRTGISDAALGVRSIFKVRAQNAERRLDAVQDSLELSRKE